MLQRKAYFAATIMQVAAFEAALQAMCFVYPEQVKKTTIYQKKRFRSKRNKALEFSLNELINIASERSWFPAKRFKYGGRVTGFDGSLALRSRLTKNYIHPGKWARLHPKTMHFNKHTFNLYRKYSRSPPIGLSITYMKAAYGWEKRGEAID